MATTTLSIQLYWASLKNEIDAETWKAGKCYITEDKAEERAEAQTGNDTLDINYCYRKIEQGIMQLQDIAHKFFVGFSRNEGKVTYAFVKVTNWTTLSKGNVVKVSGGDTDTPEDGEYTISSVETESGVTTVTFTDESGAASDSNNIYLKTKSTSSAAVTSTSSDNKLSNNVNYWDITLNFGDRQNVNISLLATELHKFVVLNVLQEWCKIANPTLTNEYVSRQQAEEVRIKSIMYRKEEPNWEE